MNAEKERESERKGKREIKWEWVREERERVGSCSNVSDQQENEFQSKKRNFFPKQNKSFPPPVIIFEKNNFSLNSVLDVESIGELEEWNSNEAEPEAWAAAEDGLGEKIYFQATMSGSIREWIIVAWVDLDLSSVALFMSCYFAVVGSNGGCHKETYRGQLSA